MGLLFFKMFSFLHLVIIVCAILMMISFINKNEKVSQILFSISFTVAFIYTFTLMGVVGPLFFLSAMFQNVTGIVMMLLLILAVWSVISFIIYAGNKYTIKKNDIKEIYIRDVDVEYSPAVLSYLMNNKIEAKKDLPATLLNLCAKNILKIEKVDNKIINIIDLKNDSAVEELMPDEKYAYKMLIEGVTSSKINFWKNKVEDEYKNYKFSKENKKTLVSYLFGLYIFVFVGFMLYFIVTGETQVSGDLAEIFGKTMFLSFIGAWEMSLFKGIKAAFRALVNRNDKNSFKESYTVKGAKEYNRWKKFEKFIEDFSIMSERKYESIIIWGKYLSYSIALGINKKCDSELYNQIEKEYSFNYEVISEMYDDKEEDIEIDETNEDENEL